MTARAEPTGRTRLEVIADLLVEALGDEELDPKHVDAENDEEHGAELPAVAAGGR